MMLLHDFGLDANINESDAYYCILGYRCTLDIH